MHDHAASLGSAPVRSFWEARQEEQVTAAARVVEGLKPLLTEMIRQRVDQLRHVNGGAECDLLRYTEEACAVSFRLAVQHNVTVSLSGRKPIVLRHPPEWPGRSGTVAPYESVPNLAGGDSGAASEWLASALAAYAGQLVRSGDLGIVVYRGDDGTAAYTYSLRRMQISADAAVEDGGSKVIAEDPGAPDKERKTYAKLEHIAGEARIIKAEHVHHLRGATEVPLPDFRGQKPLRVETLLTALPPWVLPHLHVLEGTIVQEEEYGLDEETGRIVVTRVVKTWKMSPAITLGDLVLTGWSSDDLTVDEQPYRSSGTGKKLLVAGVVAVLLLLAPGPLRLVARLFRGGI